MQNRFIEESSLCANRKMWVLREMPTEKMTFVLDHGACSDSYGY